MHNNKNRQLFVIISALVIWHLSQIFISSAVNTDNRMIDRLHDLSVIRSMNKYLKDNIDITKFHFILTSLLIDINGTYIALKFLYSNDYKPTIILLGGIILRQICQFINSSPMPENVIWLDPNFPAIIVTYYATNDFFFSGHTYISICAGMEIMKINSVFAKLYAILFIFYEIMFIIVINGHYFMDIYGAIATYFMMTYLTNKYFN